MTNSGLNYVEDSNKALQYDTHYAIANSISSTEPSLHSQPSPSSDYEEYLVLSVNKLSCSSSSSIGYIKLL